MRRRRGRAGGTAGFTLLEVLVAMVILAIGLLSLQALGVGAARAVTSAERNTEFAATAARWMELSLDSVRAGFLTTPGEAVIEYTARGDTIRRRLDAAGKRRSVTIVVRPVRGTREAAPQPFSVSSDVFVP